VSWARQKCLKSLQRDTDVRRLVARHACRRNETAQGSHLFRFVDGWLYSSSLSSAPLPISGIAGLRRGDCRSEPGIVSPGTAAVSVGLYAEIVCDFSAIFLLGRRGHSTGLDMPPS
jgi:hypothetical protein